ncbi:MAG TPA: glycosyltransferase family 2 protein [Ignavibacteria bacterium]|nr:glycosyltransferase family 2 protein [Ignavibacteria bacterium]HMR39778.1 glycosyltransferase family 2 protein [Ignavibacteria bacterium]
MTTFLIIIDLILLILLLLNIINIFSLNKIKLITETGSGDFVSVLIPARNEEDNIGVCIASVLEQNFTNFELIILNDNSTDSTLNIISSFESGKIKIINGKPLPEGWVGKNFACHQLQSEAKGDYLLFLDADTIMKQGCLASAINFARSYKTGLLSLMPYEISISFWEKTVIPMLYFALMVFLPVPLIERSGRKEIAVGNGQFMLFSRKCYDTIGGHKSLKNKIVEDVWLAKRVKEFREKLIFADGTDFVSCRMYKDFNEVWNGFSKNFFAGLSFSKSGLTVIIVLYFLLFILPLITLCSGIMNSDPDLLKYSLIGFIIPVIIRITHAIKFHQPFLFSFLNFLSSGFIIAVALNSFRILKFGKGANWKGRNYEENVIK